MSKLKMPPKGQSAAMMAELQAEHAAPEPTEHPEPVVTNVTTLQCSHELTNVTSEPASEPSPAAPHPDPQIRRDRFAAALERASADEIAVVTVRVPASLNRYMDEYVARLNLTQPKRKYRKQDAVLEAFAAFYADHPLPPAPGDEQMITR